MSEGWTVTTKDGRTLTAEEWLEEKGKKGEHGISLEFNKLQEKEVKKKRRSLRKRIIKNGITPEYDKKYSEVRYLTEEEIKKEYKMLDQIVKKERKSERSETIRELIRFLQSLEGRKVSTDVIVQKIKRPVKSVSSFLSQLFNAGIVTRLPMENHKRKFIWGIAIPYKDGEVEAIISMFNDFTAKKRRKQYLKKKEKEENKEEEHINYHSKEELKKEKEIDEHLKEKDLSPVSLEKRIAINEELIRLEDEGIRLREENEKLKYELKNKVVPLPNDITISVEGNIKFLFGLAK